MKDFIMLYQKSTQNAKRNAVIECRLLFETHWGHNAINLQQALHRIVFGEQNPNLQEDNTTEEL